MGAVVSVVSPQIEELNEYALAEKYKDMVNDNIQRWMSVVSMVTGSDSGRTDSQDVKVFIEKDPERKTEEALGLVKFFTDGDYKPNELATFLQSELFSHLQKMEHDEKFLHFEDEDEHKKAVNAIFEGLLPPVYVQWSDWDKLRTHSQLAFQGLGQYVLTSVKKDRDGVSVPESAVFEIDLSEWAQYEVREGFEKYGTISYFGEDRLPCGIYWCAQNTLVLPTDEEYQHVAMISRITLGCRLTFRDHLAGVHWIVSNGLLLASERHLHSEHPIRRLIKPHTFGAAEVNIASARTLAPVQGLAWRTFGFSESSWNDMMVHQVKAFKYQSLEEHFIASGLPDEMRSALPLYKDGLELYQIFERYVRRYVDIFYEDDKAVALDGELNDYWNDFSIQTPGNLYNLPALSKEALIAQLTHSFFTVTGFHQYAGAHIEYLMSPTAMTGALSTKRTQTTIQGCFYVLSLMALTQLKKPLLINDWTHLHAYLEDRNKPHYNQVIDAIKDWQAELVAQSAEVEKRNDQRELRGDKKFVAMDPKVMDCSVSV